MATPVQCKSKRLERHPPGSAQMEASGEIAMSLQELKALSVDQPEAFESLIEGMSERRCASLEIEGISILLADMLAHLRAILRTMGIP